MHLALGHALRPHRGDYRSRIVTRVLLVGDDADENDVLAGTKRQSLLQSGWQLSGRPGVKALVLRSCQAQIDVHDAVDVQDVRQGRQALRKVVDGSNMVGGKRTAVRVVDNRFDGGLVLAGEIAHEDVVALARLVVRRQLVDVAVGQAELQERRAGNEKDGKRRHKHHPRSTHHPHRHRMPCPVAGRLAPSEER